MSNTQWRTLVDPSISASRGELHMTPPTVVVTFFSDYAAATKSEKRLTIDDLAELVRTSTAPSKNELPWLKFARFGDHKTEHGSLRNDRNVKCITGIEADYDGEKVSFEEAVEIAEKGGISAIIYTSPSHTQAAPRWRVLCPTSTELPPSDRAVMLARLNGLYRGIFSKESWTLSQSYYLGSVNNNPDHRVEIVEGQPIDLLDELDEIAIGKPNGAGASNGHGNGATGTFDEDALADAIRTGGDFHPCFVSVVGRWAFRGMSLLDARDRVYRIFDEVPPPDRDAKWRRRRGDVERTLLGIYGKEAAKETQETEPGAAEPPPAEKWPEPLGEAAYHGIAGEFVRLAAPHTEGDPAALLFQFLTAAGNCFGDRAYFQIERTRHFPNLFVQIVGNTSKARKGTTSRWIFDVLNQAVPEWQENCTAVGLSTGEGLISRVRDPVLKANKKGELEEDDPGVKDKRLLVIEEEFSRPIRAMRRSENTLGAVLRQAWDGTTLGIMTRKDPIKAKGAMISIIGHITLPELRDELNELQAVNGFANRFLFCVVKRSKLLPFGGKVDEEDIMRIANKLRTAVNESPWGAMHFGEGARREWRQAYRELSAEHPGLYGAITARTEAQVIRVALIYALLDGDDQVRTAHLNAAIEVVRYANDSVRYIFGDATGNRIADAILQALRGDPEGLSRTEISYNLFGRNVDSAAIGAALAMLQQLGKVYSVQKTGTNGGRPAEKWRPVV